nr:hypothetical protein RKE32_27495 [Streptomyces sp. Li-HN-5-13]
MFSERHYRQPSHGGSNQYAHPSTHRRSSPADRRPGRHRLRPGGHLGRRPHHRRRDRHPGRFRRERCRLADRRRVQAAAGSSKTAAAPAGGQTVSAADETAFEKASIDVNGCAAFYKTHKVMVVENAAPGQLKATQAKVTCDKYGRQLDLGGGVSSYYKFASGASVTMFTKGLNPSGTYPRYEARKTTFDDYAKLHQPCFDTSKPDDHPADLCGNLFIYETDAGGLITSMHETWEIVD